MINYNGMEAKWQKAWADARIFESDVNDKPAYMVTAAWPYVNTPLHIGHLRAFGTSDVLARYKRMRGFNVIYPMGFHATGTPVLAFAKRIKNGDGEIVEELKVFHVPDAEIQKMTEPAYIAAYFTNESRQLYGRSGFSMDPRRSFVSTDPQFSKMVEWQFAILNSKGYLTKGRHPVGWCPNENNAVGMHDTKHDVEPEIEEEIAVLFRVDGEDAYVLCTTYRPETLFGVTNMFVNEKSQYVACRIGDDGKRYYISKAAASMLKYQTKVEVIEEIGADKLLAKTCINPINGSKLPVLPGFFVKEGVGTGVVMSVPAHAPFDYAALERLRKEGRLQQEIKPIKMLDVKIGRSLSDVSTGDAKPEHLDVPALAYLEILHTNVDAIDDMLEFATKLEYREESHWGKMLAKGYEGMSEPEARERMKKELASGGNAISIYVLQNTPVYCRCGYEVVVKVVEDQWFINYGDKAWKEEAKKALGRMKLLPDRARNAFDAAMGWIDMRAVARAQGLGTVFPLDKTKIIESLSDSTIYMSFYTISNFVKDIAPEKLKPEFFDFVFRGIGDADKVAASTGIDYSIIKKCRESFEYWYRDTSRGSGPDLIFNHLVMYIYNHTAVFDNAYWPKQIVINGFVMSEGEKMSKSLGNIVPLSDALEKYGADPSRMNVIAGADLYSDSDFSGTAVRGIQERLEYLYNAAMGLDKLSSGELKSIDYWLYSRLNGKIGKATIAMEKLELRDAYISIFYDSVLELRRYFARGGGNGIVVKDFLSGVALMLQPMTPHFAEEMWHALGNGSFASLEKWPEADKDMIDAKAESMEEAIEKTLEDARQAIALMEKKSGRKAAALKLMIAEDWKRKLVGTLAKERRVDKAIASVRGEAGVNTEIASRIAAMLAKRMNELRPVDTAQQDEYAGFADAAEYMAKQLGCRVEVEKEAASKSERAWRAMPLKPSLDIAF